MSQDHPVKYPCIRCRKIAGSVGAEHEHIAREHIIMALRRRRLTGPMSITEMGQFSEDGYMRDNLVCESCRPDNPKCFTWQEVIDESPGLKKALQES